MTFQRLGLAVIAAWLLGGAALLAATFSEQTSSLSSLGGKPALSRTIRMTGLIEEGDAVRLRTLLTDLRKSVARTRGMPLATVEMSSQGGDLLEAMKLGYLFREFDVATLVRRGDSCLSSCALAFLGGTARHGAGDTAVARTLEVGASLGFHNFYLNPYHEHASNAATPREGIAMGFNEAKGAASLLVHYAVSLGVDANFIARMLGRPPESWDYADTAGMFIDLKICPVGLSRRMPEPHVSAINICANTLGEAAQGAPTEVRRMLPAEAKRHLLAHVRKNVASFSVKGPVAVQLATIAASRDDRLVDAIYADLRAAGLPLPEIVGPTFEIEGFGAGIYEVTCVVSLSPDDPDRFDLVLETPTGLVRPARQAAPSCGRLLSFDRGDLLNPERH